MDDKSIHTRTAGLQTYQLDGQKITAAHSPAGLHVVSTPIGNLADVTLRALGILAGSDLILCEDTRITSRLLQHYGIQVPMTAYHDHNAGRMRPVIMQHLANNQAIALVSDAGTPVISDPGFKLINACLAQRYDVHAVPGVSAPITALTLSGLPSDRFVFAGFAPAKTMARQKFLTELANNKATLILFESPKRLTGLLADIGKTLPQRQIVVARELTKKFEEIVRGSLDNVAADFDRRSSIKGEITVLIGPPSEPVKFDDDTVNAAIAEALQEHSASQAASLVAQTFGLKKKDIYARILALKSPK